MSKKTVIKGAMILAITGILTRFIGFGYRIFLSNLIGATQLGIYHMIFPVFGICATIYGSGIQTAISHLTASVHNKHASTTVLFTGILLSLSLSLSLAGIIFFHSDFIAEKLLLEPSTARPLRILVTLFPFCGITSCINGYYYGNQKTAIPAISQFLEQCVRVFIVYFLSVFFAGENLFIVNLLSSAEAILIPACLQRYGLSSEESFSIYGILTGMSLPFLMFPSTITNSLSVLLLPAVAQAQSSGNKQQIGRTCSVTIYFCLLIGLFSTTIFLVLGNSLGIFFFHNAI